MITCYRAEPMCDIISFVYSLLQPLIDHIIHTSFTFPTGNHIITALEKYVQKGSLRSTTHFVKIEIHHLCTILPHHLLISALEKFLHIYVRSQQIEGTSITTIIELVQITLENQFCIYENKLYRQTVGVGSICSTFIQGLVDIYLYQLQYTLTSILFNNKTEVIGRHLNQIIFIWNESKNDLQTLLNQVNIVHSKHIPTQITAIIDSKIKYLDVEISHHEGRLQTRVYHDVNYEPYALPHLLETKIKSKDYEDLLVEPLIRALFYCSNIDELENERLFIEVSFIINDKSIDRIQRIVHEVLVRYNMFIADTCIDKDTYENRRRQHFKRIPRQTNKYTLEERERERQRCQQQKQCRRQRRIQRQREIHRQQQIQRQRRPH